MKPKIRKFLLVVAVALFTVGVWVGRTGHKESDLPPVVGGADPRGCKGTTACTRFGRCSDVNGSCEAWSKEDCARSENCRRYGACGLVEGGCVPKTPMDCMNSESCQVGGQCTYLEMECIGESGPPQVRRRQKRSGASGPPQRIDSKNSRIPDCDATAIKEQRPVSEEPGCMVPIAGDEFQMGAQSRDENAPGFDPLAEDNEGPVHTVEVASFWLHLYEVTVWEFKGCVEAGACKLKDVKVAGGYFDYAARDETPRSRGGIPINGVSWFGARDYCAWIGGRLPTETEWEFVARGGKRQLRYPWYPDVPPTCEHAVFNGGAAKKCGFNSTREVNDRLPAGEHPVFYVVHLAGNVWEWVADWYSPDYYTEAPLKNPRGPDEGVGKVQRGGGWSDDAPTVFRTTYRAQMPPDFKLADVGFRCATDSIY